jgi:hypothetical protein
VLLFFKIHQTVGKIFIPKHYYCHENISFDVVKMCTIFLPLGVSVLTKITVLRSVVMCTSHKIVVTP